MISHGGNVNNINKDIKTADDRRCKAHVEEIKSQLDKLESRYPDITKQVRPGLRLISLYGLSDDKKFSIAHQLPYFHMMVSSFDKYLDSINASASILGRALESVLENELGLEPIAVAWLEIRVRLFMAKMIDQYRNYEAVALFNLETANIIEKLLRSVNPSWYGRLAKERESGDCELGISGTFRTIFFLSHTSRNNFLDFLTRAPQAIPRHYAAVDDAAKALHDFRWDCFQTSFEREGFLPAVPFYRVDFGTNAASAIYFATEQRHQATPQLYDDDWRRGQLREALGVADRARAYLEPVRNDSHPGGSVSGFASSEVANILAQLRGGDASLRAQDRLNALIRNIRHALSAS